MTEQQNGNQTNIHIETEDSTFIGRDTYYGYSAEQVRAQVASWPPPVTGSYRTYDSRTAPLFRQFSTLPAHLCPNLPSPPLPSFWEDPFLTYQGWAAAIGGSRLALAISGGILWLVYRMAYWLGRRVRRRLFVIT